MKLLITLMIFFSSASNVFAWTDHTVFGKYKNKYFVETGTYEGAGIQHALLAGFDEIYSIEIAPYYYEKALKNFKDYPNVHLILGDSSTALWDVIRDINEPITFWLDGHYSGGNTGISNSGYSPILLELDCIKNHPVKNHTILIDDARLFGTQDFDYVTTFQIILKLQEINLNYEIKYDQGYIPHDVLVAHPK